LLVAVTVHGDADEAAVKPSLADPAEPSSAADAPEPSASGESPSADTS
jgi:hypothetical protein